ncbi:hypothetical protein KC19_7G151500 [Ceratodon purpureus]|uniref:Protein kinase domain-containing protein n=1 Tax=Ceratodon purpureus TaxID=3225 RepID=A0A8T0H9X9_CERPU|nr:hypothetical protein KC19_7G151500 [Ceratodon purpureus]
MEHKQLTTDEPSSASSSYYSTLEELDVASSSVYTSAVEDAKELTSSRFWTSTDYTSDIDYEGYVRVLPGKNVATYTIDQIIFLEKIDEGGQGTIYTVKIDAEVLGDSKDDIRVVKLYKGRRCGQWPAQAFGLHLFGMGKFICKFDGYCLEGDSFYLIMEKYDCSLRNVLNKHMNQDDSKARPLPDVIALLTIIQIAIGMWFLHDNNIIHRDLKADNVFVTLCSSGVPLHSYIGDFDVASNVVGTLFWRAPEVLQALKDGNRHPVFTRKADVYSYAMTCYEILTGGVPLEGVAASNYDAVLVDRMRPKLPSDLNPKLKGLLERCWHQDPQVRPTFKEILVELRELHKELIAGSELVSEYIEDMFRDAMNSVDSLEATLLELKMLLQATLVKYDQPDHLVALMEAVDIIEEYQSRFGLRSMKEHPVLPLQEYLARLKMFDKVVWKFQVFQRLIFQRSHVVEMGQIRRLWETIYGAMTEGEEGLGSFIQPELSSVEDEFLTDLAAFVEERQARVLPEQRHVSLEVHDNALQSLLSAEYTSQMSCGGGPPGTCGQILSLCRQWLGID